MSDASFTFNPYAQDDGRINLGVDLREGTIPAGAGAVIEPNPQPDPEPEDEDQAPEQSDPQPEPDAAASGDPAPAPKPETKVLTAAGKQPARTGPKPRTK